MAAALLISVVDDDSASREAAAGLIRSMGHRVAEFGSAAAFLASDELKDTGLLITDLRMPGMSGLELHRHLVATGNAVPTAIVTAYPTEASREHALKAGILAVLRKPLAPRDLAACVKAVPPS